MQTKKITTSKCLKMLLPIFSFILIFPFSVLSQILPDAYEADNTYDQAAVIILNDNNFQRHNFHTPEDEDWIKIYGINKKIYHIEAVPDGSECDIVISLYDTEGAKLLATGDHGFKGEDEYLEWNCEADGIYYAKIGGYDISGEDTGYDLRAFRPHSCISEKIIGKISDAVSGEGIGDVRIKTDKGDSAITESDGAYTLFAACGCDSPFTLTVEAEGYEIYTETFIAECGVENSKNIIMNPQKTVSGPKAVIIAGGPVSGNDLWNITRILANSAYRTLLYQGFTKESIYYLSHDTESDLDGNGKADDTDGIPSKENLQNALLKWALNAESLTIYLTGHGGNGLFRLNSTEILRAGELDGWLDTLQESFSGKLTIICDTDEAGIFLSQLSPSAGKQRILLGNASAGQGACFLNNGLVSFSAYFWRGIFAGYSVYNAFMLAKQGTEFMKDRQTPFLDDNADGLSSAADGITAKDVFIGNATAFPGAAPLIENVSPPQSFSETATAELSADVTDPDGIVRVWAVLIPPGYLQGKKTVTALPSFDLLSSERNRYEGKFEAFYTEGVWQAAVFASDSTGSISVPKMTALTFENPPVRKAIIVAGKTGDDAFQSAVEKVAGLAYKALAFQGYSDKDIFFMTPSASSPGADALPSLSNLENAVKNWADENTQNLLIYLTGKGDNTGFQLNDTESLSPEMLDNWLDTFQNEMSVLVTLVYDADKSGSFLPLLTPPSGKKRILIAGTGGEQDACFLSEGNISFSGFFWQQVMKGRTTGKAFSDAAGDLYAFCGKQTPILDDNGDGAGNDANDGKFAAGYPLGLGIKTADDLPVVGSVSPGQLLGAETSAEIWAAGVNAVEGIAHVRAMIVQSGAAANAGKETELVYQADSGKYSGRCEDLSACGDYRLAVYAEDMSGGISLPLTTLIQKDTGTALHGDLNGDCRVGLDDAVVGLKALAGEDISGQIRLNYPESGADVNNDGCIGLAEAVYILTRLAG